jgi:DNA-directed RNA polymerase II subunit RPB1
MVSAGSKGTNINIS